MRANFLKAFTTAVLILLVFGFSGCGQENGEKKVQAMHLETTEAKGIENRSGKSSLSEEFKKYWYAGNAEITSYRLEQARYGEIREGKAVLIFVTEPFLPEIQVKADRNARTNVPVLKLNFTKNYLTGIYPYSIMSSTFYPVANDGHALKTSLSVQEWCGHVYAQLNNRDRFEFTSHSYFEGEADQHVQLDKAWLENEIWNKARIDPMKLPQGTLSIIPTLEYFRVQHQRVQAYTAVAKLEELLDKYIYSIEYRDTNRKLILTISSSFPYQIEGWEEQFTSGFGANAKTMVSKGTKIATLKTPYWEQNSNTFLSLRDSLGL